MSILSVVQSCYAHQSKAHDKIYNSDRSNQVFELSSIGLEAKYWKSIFLWKINKKILISIQGVQGAILEGPEPISELKHA